MNYYQYLIFDLDETLYPRSAGVMQEIARLIVMYMTERLGFTAEKANQLRRRFFAQYGTTLRGLLTEYQVDTEDYLRFVHDINIQDYIAPDPHLDAMLHRIPLTKVIFTSANQWHAQRVLAQLGIRQHFQTILDIQATGLYNKPDPRSYELVLRALGAAGPECILIEDSARNLRPAKELFGMTTILVDGQLESGVDIALGNLLELENALCNLSGR
jgi:putative hydrolase of the HAD superfamily